jgi:ABC-type multidrug transport system ATPase subunit
MLVLLLGAPGSGRTTLLEVLSGRKKRNSNNIIEGIIKMNGQPWNSHFNRVAGFVTQEDVHIRMSPRLGYSSNQPTKRPND